MYISWSGYFSSKYFVIKKNIILYFLFFYKQSKKNVTIKERKAFENGKNKIMVFINI